MKTIEQGVRLLRGQNRRRLVENEDAGLSIERFENFNALSFTDREIADAGIRVNCETEIARELFDLTPNRCPASATGKKWLGPESNIVHHRQIVCQREVLVNHADSGGERRTRITGRQGPTKYFDTALIGNVMAEENIHQRGFSSAVFTKQRKNLTLSQGEVDIRIGGQRAKAFCDALKAEDNLPRLMSTLAHNDLGSLSSIFTVNEPSLIAASFFVTFAMTSAGTLPLNVPSGESEQPPSFMKE